MKQEKISGPRNGIARPLADICASAAIPGLMVLRRVSLSYHPKRTDFPPTWRRRAQRYLAPTTSSGLSTMWKGRNPLSNRNMQACSTSRSSTNDVTNRRVDQLYAGIRDRRRPAAQQPPP